MDKSERFQKESELVVDPEFVLDWQKPEPEAKEEEPKEAPKKGKK